MCKWKNSENLLTFGEDMDNKKWVVSETQCEFIAYSKQVSK